jgi:hypothetical protein
VNPVVDGVDELTPEWLGTALGRRVRSVGAEQIGTGQMGASWRLTLAYDGEPGPSTVVAKLAAGDPAARGQVSVGFAKEVGFYTALAAGLDLRLPHCWYGAISDDSMRFTLLLEDLAPSTPGVQVDGCTVEQAAGAVRNLAALHASSRCDPSLEAHAFLAPIGGEVAELFAAAYTGAVDQFVERYAPPLADADVATLRAASDVMGAWLVDRPEPFAVVHGDYRLDNLMFPPEGDVVAALDWQTVSVGPPTRDLAYFLGNSLHPEDRRAHEDALVATYHRELVARGVEGYDLDRCAEDYRAGHLQGPLITVLGAVYATAERSDAADRMFLAMASRSCAAIRELDTLALVGS